MPPVCRQRPTIAAVEPAVVRIDPTVVRVRAELHSSAGSGVGDAVRPGVVSADRDAARGPALDGEQQAVVVGRSPTVQVIHESVTLVPHTFEAEPPALVLIGGC